MRTDFTAARICYAVFFLPCNSGAGFSAAIRVADISDQIAARSREILMARATGSDRL